MKVLCGLVIAFLAAFLLVWKEPVSAQVYVNGQPLISTGGTVTGADSDAAYIDAFVYSSTGDMCARISAAWNAVLSSTVSSATVDARGFTGSQTCALGPFNTTRVPHGILLLGNVDIGTSVTWVLPSQLEVRGTGSGGGSGSSSDYNSIIYACPSTCANPFPTTGAAVLQMGPSTGGPWFSVRIAYLTVDCHGVSECTGILNEEAEENSTVDHVQIWDAPAYGLHVSVYNTLDTTHPGATNSGPYHNINVEFSANCNTNCSKTTTVGIEADGYGSTNFARAIRGFNAVTVSGDGAGGTGGYIAAGVVICGVSGALTNSHIEFATTGLWIGAGGGCNTSYTGFDTRSVQVSNVSIGTNTGVAGQNAIIIGSTSNTPPTGDVVLTAITDQTVNGNITTLTDHLTGTTLASTTDQFLGYYAIGHCPCGGSGQPAYPALLTTSPTVGWQDPAVIKKPSGSFSINHPLDPANQFLNHSFVESPDMMNIYNGSVTTDSHGVATVILPSYFEALNRDFRYQLTAVGQLAQAFVARKIQGNRFMIKTNKPGVEVSWQVTGIRHDAYANEHRIQVEEAKPASLRNH
jgi:hypothetical protein